MRLLLATVLILLLAPAAAVADANLVDQTVALGEEFWHDRGVTPCPNPEINVDTAPEGVSGEAELGGCKIWINATLVSAANREHWKPNRGGDSAREDLCHTVVHELGHTAGLEHTDTGVMAPMVGDIPWACVQWREQLDRLDRQASRQQRVSNTVGVGVERGRWSVHRQRQSLRLVIPGSFVD